MLRITLTMAAIALTALFMAKPAAAADPVATAPTTGPNEPFPGKKSDYHGYARYDFPAAGRQTIVVVPKNPAPGLPWLWRAEFFDTFATVDQALLDKGFHLVFINCANTFGSPETVRRWAELYDMLTTEHGFSKKPVLLGMSRGGLYVYAWAAAHPDKVGLIYGDAPVCDIKSWPGGKGKSKGSLIDWREFMRIFDLTEPQALQWKGNPIDMLEPIAKAKIPIIHVVGDADDIVPVPENTSILIQRYEQLGGHVELINKPGVGHHPHSLSDPTPIVDYILKNRLPD